jgi:Fic-DOC domain mobile mystery protein B
MSDVPFDGDDEANTPLTPEEREQLIPAYISFRSELNQAEQANIADGSRWFTLGKRDVLDQLLLIELHKRMFGQVWRWAGSYRTTARNIGIDAYGIQIEMRKAVDDARYWVEAEKYSPDEIAVRFSHRVVEIHPFPNGNGRFSRLVGDMLAIQLGQPAFTWGSANLVDVNETRRRYLAALKAADAYDIGPLLAFARS